MFSLAMAENMIGLDMGTYQSCVGVVHNGKVEIIPNELGKSCVPSYIAFTDYGILIGESAKLQAPLNPKNTIFNYQFLLGKRFDEVQDIVARVPYDIINQDGLPFVSVSLRGEKILYSPEEITAIMVDYLRDITEQYIGEGAIDMAVMSIPAHCNDAQRSALKKAGEIGGITSTIRVSNEPVLSGIAYGIDSEYDEALIIEFHAGAENFEVTLLEIDEGVYEILSNVGSFEFGGNRFTERLVDYLVDYWKNGTGLDVKSDISSKYGNPTGFLNWL